MKVKKTTALSRSPGRPRSETARQQILESAYRLLKLKPIVSISAQEIAQSAGVSTATLYRRWGTKEQVLFEACLEHLKLVHSPAGDGSALEQLRAHISSSVGWIRSEEGKVLARVLAGIQEDKDLQRSFIQKFYSPRREMHRRLIEEAIADGDLSSGTDAELMIDALFGPLFFRWLQGHAPVDHAFADALSEKIIGAFTC